MKYTAYLLFVLINLLSNGLHAQEYCYTHYDAKDGLADNHVYHVVQDHDGFLWFATAIGVSRFDGTKFLNFTTADGLPDNDVVKLFVDSKNRVWMMPFKNSLCYFYKNKIYNATNDSLLSKIKLQSNVKDIQEDGKGNIIIGEINRTIIINAENKISPFTYFNGFLINNYSFGLDNNKNIVATIYNSTLLRKDFLTIGVNSELTTIDKYEFIKNNKINYSKFSFCNGAQIIEHGFTKNAKSIFSISTIQTGRTLDTVIDASINSCSNFSSTIAHINTKRGCIEWHFTDNSKTKHYLPSENIGFSFIDNEKNTWFTTLGSGIFRLVSSDIKNIKFNNKEAIKNQIHALYAHNSRIFAGSGEKKVYSIEKERMTTEAEINTAETGKIIKIRPFDNKYFLYTELGLFSTIDFLTFNSVFFDKNYAFKDIDISEQGDFYFATNSSLIKKRINEKQEISLFSGRCFNVCIADNYLYFSTLKGLHRIDLKRGTTEYLGDIDSALQSKTTKLLGHKNVLWIGTNDNGLLGFDGNKVIHKINAQNGLTSNIVTSLYADNDFIYVGTDKGFNKIELKDNKIVQINQITIQNGLLSNKINGICKLNNTLYLATPYGISYFEDKDNNNMSNCDLKITDLIVDGKQKQDSLHIVLSAGAKNSLVVKFVGISFKAAEGTQYFYRLKGGNTNEWKQAETNILEFIALPSGNYQLEIKAINGFGKESQIETIQFDVAKMLLEQWWFRILALLILSLIIWRIFNWQITNLKRKEKQKLDTNLKIADLEQRALKAQMNPHFIFNCLNSIQQFVIEHDVQGANKFISKFSKLVRQTLDNSGKEKISVEEEINFLTAYLDLEKMRFEDKFTYIFAIDTSINRSETYIPPMLLQPFIENSIRHGIRLLKNTEGVIEVKIKDVDNHILCILTDNGVGREAAAQFKNGKSIEYQSKGMMLTEQRIDVLNANKKELITIEINDKDITKTGTEVLIRFPKSFTDSKPVNKT